jgi:hypothetical protein
MMTAGLDLGDNYGYLSAWWMAKAVRSSRRACSAYHPGGFHQALQLRATAEDRHRGGHLLARCGHEVLEYRNPARHGRSTPTTSLRDRQARCLKKLARPARADPELLYPMEHRGEDCARLSPGLDLLPGGFGLQPHPADQPRVRGTVRSFGVRLPRCSARSFHKKGARPELPSKLVEGLEPIIQRSALALLAAPGYRHVLSELPVLPGRSLSPTLASVSPHRG